MGILFGTTERVCHIVDELNIMVALRVVDVQYKISGSGSLWRGEQNL